MRGGLLASIVLLGACTGGGGGGGDADPIEWGRFRHDNANSGLAVGTVGDSRGDVKALLQLDAAGYGVTSSTPIIGPDGIIYLGTARGLLAFNKSGEVQWLFECFHRAASPNDICNQDDPCDPANGDIVVGAISSSPAITIEEDIVFGADNGVVFALRDLGKTFTCKWAYATSAAAPVPVLSSPALLIDPTDRSLLTAYVATGSGYLQALNGDGTEQWRFPRTADALGALSASPAVATDGTIVFTSPDGFVQALSPGGQLRSRVPVDASQQGADRLPSPALGASVYSIGAVVRCERSDAACTSDSDCPEDRCITKGQMTAVNPDGTVKWRYRGQTPDAPAKPILGSPAYVLQTVIEDDVIDGGTTNVIDTIVYVVDDSGTVYGVRDTTGELFVFRDSDDNAIKKPALLRLMANGVSTSPVLSSDVYIVFASDDGYVYAVQVNTDVTETRPCWDCSDAQWETLQPDGGGRVKVSSSPIRSSPIIDDDGTIYVTADDGVLYAIGTQ